jgi:hypothetical protein
MRFRYEIGFSLWFFIPYGSIAYLFGYEKNRCFSLMVFKKWSRKDLLSNDRVFTSRYVYKLKLSAITGEVYRFKARLIVRGFQMEKGVDFDDSFSPTPGLASGRFMLSLAVANDYELYACDIEQAFLQADKLPEGVNGRYFIQPPPGSPDANNRDVVYEVCRPLYGNPSSPRALHKTRGRR